MTVKVTITIEANKGVLLIYYLAMWVELYALYITFYAPCFES